MATLSTRIRSYAFQSDFICLRCLQFSTTSVARSGHSRWSKIKHDKGTADAKRSGRYSSFAHEIALESKMGGPNPNMNPRLASVLATAKKAGFSKSNMEAAIARGQGRSSTGATLEYVTLETIMPPTIAMIIEAETDNANRTLSDLRLQIKKHGGVVTPTSYLFEKKGRVGFENERNLGVDDVLDEAIEAGAEDVEAEEDGTLVVWTEPGSTTSAAQSLQKSLGLKVQSSDLIWDPNDDTKVQLDSAETATALSEFIDAVRDDPSVQSIYANVAQGSLSGEAWEDLQGKLDA